MRSLQLSFFAFSNHFELLSEMCFNRSVWGQLSIKKQGMFVGWFILVKKERNIQTQQCVNLLLLCLYLFLMTNQARFQMVNRIINQNKGKLNLHELQNRFGSKLTSKMIKKYEFTNNKFLKKYSLIERRYDKGINKPNPNEWLENQRKLFIWLSIIFCNHLHTNYDQLLQKDWQVLSHLFFQKSIILLQYETKQIQRNPQRVDWAKREQAILLQAVGNGKLGQWNQISRTIFLQTGGKDYKTSKQCRQHWFNHLDKSKKKGDWLKSEDLLLLQTVKNEGRKWSTITHLLGQRRTEHMVKNRFNSLINSVIRTEQAYISEESILENLIATLQAEIQQYPDEKMEGQEQEDRQEMDDEQSSQRKLSKHEEIEQSSINQQVSAEHSSSRLPLNGQIRYIAAIPEQNITVMNQGWTGIMNNQTVQSHYYFVFSPFSFSSTANPYMSSYQSWSGWNNPAHQTLLFNSQSQSKPQFNSSPSLEIKEEYK